MKAKKAINNSQKQTVMVSDGCRLPFADATFDVVTSFETIEHLEDRAQFIAELRRVLKPDGLLILSTPNALFTEPVNGKPRNPFHVFEYTPDELTKELRGYFAEVEHFGQILNPAFGITPFQDHQQKLPRNLNTQAKLLGWKVFNKLPVSIRENLSQALWGRPFYPGENDYLFERDALAAGHVQVALCRGFAKK
jgi:SAM-dependent methyltransferase